MNPSPRTILNAWLREIEPGLGLNSQGVCGLEYGHGGVFTVEVPETGSCFYLYAPLIDLQPGRDRELLKRALTLNLYQFETKGGAVAMDPRGQRLALCYTGTTSACDGVGFRNILENFGEAVKNLRTKIRDEPQEPASEEPTMSPAMNGFILA